MCRIFFRFCESVSQAAIQILMSQRKIIHIDMDAFYASVEQRDHPEYRGKPIAVGGLPEKRGVVATASYEARKYGIHSAMSSYRALKLCPDLIFVRPRFDAYKEASLQIRRIFADYTDLIEPLSLDEAYLDITENKPGIPSATLIAREIKARIFAETGLTASAGVSYNKFLAKVASDLNKPDGLTLITPQQAERFIETLPIGKFYGIGQKTEPRLKAMGIHTGADLKALPEEAMEQLFGRSAPFYYQMVRGVDERPVETSWIRKSVGAENTFERDLEDPAEMLEELRPLVLDVLDWMRRNDTYGRTLTLKVKYDDFQQITRSRTVDAPLTTLEDIMALLQSLLATTEAGKRKVRLLGVSLAKLEDRKEKQPDNSSTSDALSRQLLLEF
jgi:DNA polymerase-4